MRGGIRIYHNILWSKYKGGVFTSLYKLCLIQGVDVEFVQIAETEGLRAGLGSIDLSYHDYPYELMFKGSYDSIPRAQLICKLVFDVFRTKASVVVLPGYHLPEYWAMLMVAKIRGKRVSVFCDSTKFDRPQIPFKVFLKRFFFFFCDAIFGYGVRSSEYVLMHGVPSKKIFHRCQAAALPHTYNSKDIPDLRLSNISSKFRVLYVGRLSPEKELLTLLKAFKLLRKSISDAQLIIVGEGSQKEDLVRFSLANELSDSVIFTGAKQGDDLANEYLKASCLVLPSSSEPWGLVVNEALSYGCPVVVSDRCGCVPELVIDGITGLSFETGNVVDLALKFEKIIDIGQDVDFVTRCCLRVISNYQPSDAACQILKGLDRVVGDR